MSLEGELRSGRKGEWETAEGETTTLDPLCRIEEVVVTGGWGGDTSEDTGE